MPEISVNLPVLSTAFLPDARFMLSGHSTGMDLTVILENIERLLRVKKMGANKVSAAAGKPDAIRNIKRKINGGIKGNGLNVETLEALAKALGTTSAELRAKPERIDIQRPIGGLRETLLSKIAWLDKERDQALRELEAIDLAEQSAKKAPKRRAAR